MDMIEQFEEILNRALPKESGLKLVTSPVPTQGVEVRLYKDGELIDSFWYSTLDMMELVIKDGRQNNG